MLAGGRLEGLGSEDEQMVMELDVLGILWDGKGEYG